MKKSKRSNLENKKTLFFEMGLVTVLGLLLVAFNWQTPKGAAENLGIITAVPLEDDMVQRTIHEEKKPPKPRVEPPVVTALKIVDDTEDVDDFDIETEFINDEGTIQRDFTPEPEVEEKEEHPFIAVPQKGAKFPGGEKARKEFMQNNIRYPQEARDNGISGTVFIQFKVGAYGEIMDINVARSPDPSLSAEALRVVKLMPRWEPAMQGNQRVVTLITLPVNFTLR